MKRTDDTILHGILLVSDITGCFLSIIIAFAIRYQLFLGISKNGDSLWLAAILLIVTAVVNVFMSPVDHYITRGTFAEITDVAIRQLISVAGTILILYLVHRADSFSRLVFGYYLILSILIVWGFRLLVKRYLKKNYKSRESATRLIIIASQDKLSKIVKRFNSSNEWKRIITKTIPIDIDGYDKTIEYIVHNEVDEVFVSVSDILNPAAYQEFIRKLVGMGIKVDIDINQFELDVPGSKSIDEIGKYAVVSIAKGNLTISQQFLKRSMDIVFGIIGMIVFAIAFMIVGPLIKFDSEGPVIFIQKRVGKNGRVFDLYKFRSMYKDADEHKAELMDQNESNGLMFKMENDPRITKIGKFLRKHSIDELPQFWNVLKGDMSLVGTRPPTIDEYERYESWHKSRLSMKPGITGLWQVSGRSDIKDFDEVVKLDIQYIDNWSILKDVKIILKTIGYVFSGKGSR